MEMDINELRGKLLNRLRQEAGLVAGEHHDDRLAKMVLVHQAIQALDAVTAAGGPEEPGEPRIFGVSF